MDIPLFLSLLLLGILTCASCDTCPPPEDIDPCTCKLSNREIYIHCDGVSLQEMEDAFDSLRGKTIESVRISDVDGDRLPSLLFWDTRVREIRFSDCDLRELSDSDAEPAFLGLEDSLQILDVVNSIKGDNQLKTLALSHLKILNRLSLSGNNIPEVGNDWFAQGPLSLTIVSFVDCELSQLGDTAFARLTNLRVLRLAGNRITTIDRSMIPNLAPHLEILDLENNKLTSLQNGIFSGMPLLKIVYLRKNSIKRIEENTWSSVWETLEVLYLEDNPLQCDFHMEWTFSIRRPKIIYGTCASPRSVKGQTLSYFIDNNRQLLSLTGKQSGSSSKNALRLNVEDNPQIN